MSGVIVGEHYQQNKSYLTKCYFTSYVQIMLQPKIIISRLYNAIIYASTYYHQLCYNSRNQTCAPTIWGSAAAFQALTVGGGGAPTPIWRRRRRGHFDRRRRRTAAAASKTHHFRTRNYVLSPAYPVGLYWPHLSCRKASYRHAKTNPL